MRPFAHAAGSNISTADQLAFLVQLGDELSAANCVDHHLLHSHSHQAARSKQRLFW